MRQEIDWIEKMNGMALMIVHPDYIRPDEGRSKESRHPIEYYEELLQYVKKKGAYWHALPEMWRDGGEEEITRKLDLMKMENLILKGRLPRMA